MFFSKSLLIPPNTPRAELVRATIRVTQGVVKHVWVRWRWGVSADGGARILYQGFQFWPLAIGQWFPLSPDPLDFEDYIPLRADPYILTIEAYNEDLVYDEELWIAVSVMQEREDIFLSHLLNALDIIIYGS